MAYQLDFTNFFEKKNELKNILLKKTNEEIMIGEFRTSRKSIVSLGFKVGTIQLQTNIFLVRSFGMWNGAWC